MRTLVLVILLLGLAIVVGKLSYSEPGVLTIGYQGWLIETSPIAVLVAVVTAIVLLYAVLKLFSILIGIPGFVHSRSRAGRLSRANKRLVKGFIELVEGRAEAAEKHLSRVENGQESALINYLSAARAAQAQKSAPRRDSYLDNAAKAVPQASTAIDIVRAELQIEQKDYDSALETLAFLRSSSPRQPRVIRLLASVYLEQRNWSKLDALLPVIRRRRALPEAEIATIELACWRGMIESGDESRLEGYWQRLPKSAQQSTELLSLYVDRLIAANKHNSAEKVAREYLNKQWDEKLAGQYARIELEDANKQLNYAEGWIGAQGRSPALLLTLGQLCLRCQLWGKARVYLESSLGIKDSAVGSLLLADLLVRLGEQDNARDHYAKGLKLALDKPIDAPQALPDMKDQASDESRVEESATRDLKLVENKAG